MFRASLRSASDPLRAHVCFTCLGPRFASRPPLRQFYTTSPFRASQSDGQAVEAIAQSTESLIGTPESKEEIPATEVKPRKQPHGQRKQRRKPNNSAPDDDPSAATPAGSISPKGAKAKTAKPRVVQKEVKVRRVLSTRRVQNDAEKDAEKDAESDATPEGAAANGDKVPQKEPPKDASTKAVASTDSRANLLRRFGRTIRQEHGSLDAHEQPITALDVEKAPVPGLSFGLERVLFNPGVYHLRDPRSRVYNFDPYLGSIMPVTEFDFTALKDYITSSKDESLRMIARKEQKKYIGSSSSMTSVLSHFHYLLSDWRPVNTQTISQGFPDKLRTFTRLLRSPAAMFLHWQDGVYAIDADKEFDSANILMNLGKSMEKLLTLPKEDFERYRRSSENKISAEEENAIPESYHYSTYGDFVMRSQLDAYDPRLPGTGMFDLKTRAVVSIRMDSKNFEHGLGYEIKDRFGGFESYEREYFDMIRAAFLKYSLQVRVGRMDGIFVAFHNIERIFGFQYVSLPEMDLALHGQNNTALGDAEFRLSLTLWNKILDQATAKYPQQSLRFHFETREAPTLATHMLIFVEPVTPDEIHAIQTKNQAAIDAYQQRILNLTPKEGEPNSSASEPAATVQADEAHDAESSTEPERQVHSDEETESQSTDGKPVPPAKDESAATPDGESSDTQNATQQQEKKHREVLAMILVIKNIVNGKVVHRPEKFKTFDRWTVNYDLFELQSSQVPRLYKSCQLRREKALAGRGEDETDVAANVYIRQLREISKRGREWRQKENELDKEKGIVVLSDSIETKP